MPRAGRPQRIERGGRVRRPRRVLLVCRPRSHQERGAQSAGHRAFPLAREQPVASDGLLLHEPERRPAPPRAGAAPSAGKGGGGPNTKKGGAARTPLLLCSPRCEITTRRRKPPPTHSKDDLHRRAAGAVARSGVGGTAGRSPAHGVARKHEIRQCLGASTSPRPLPRTSVAVFRRSRAAPDGCTHGKGPDLRLPAIPPRAWRGSFASRSRVASRTRSTAALLLIREPPQSLARNDPAGRSLLAPPP